MNSAKWIVAVGLTLAVSTISARAEPASDQRTLPQAEPVSPSQPIQSPPTGPTPNAAILQTVNDAKLSDHGVKDGINPAILRAEVMLDRLNVSPGVIDGLDGENVRHALVTYEKMQGLKATGLDAKVWDSLLRASAKPVLIEYTTTAEDVAGPYFPDLPKDYSELAKLPTIGYRNPSQKLGAKFHMGERLLAELNPGVDLGKAGQKLVVADVKAEPVRARLQYVVVDKGTGQVVGYDWKGRTVIAVPATIGSRELPSPSGTYRIKGIAQNPKYYYDPKNFVQGDNKEKLTLPAGPNNPVGSVFMALTKPTYGLHGTPDPSDISKTASHGCVRMTNWDAEELSKLVRPGMLVRFKG